jgi:hypothetical protein
MAIKTSYQVRGGKIKWSTNTVFDECDNNGKAGKCYTERSNCHNHIYIRDIKRISRIIYRKQWSECMKVLIDKKIYQMGTNEYRRLLDIAKEQMPKGIYAIEKKGYAELKNKPARSTTELMRDVKSYKLLGFKVHYNR